MGQNETNTAQQGALSRTGFEHAPCPATTPTKIMRKPASTKIPGSPQAWVDTDMMHLNNFSENFQELAMLPQ